MANAYCNTFKSLPGSFDTHIFLQNKVYFIGSYAEHEDALWVFDSDNESSRFIADLYPNTTKKNHSYSFFSNDSENLYISVNTAQGIYADNAELWVFNVKSESIIKLFSIENAPNEHHVATDSISKLIFTQNKAMFLASRITEAGKISQIMYESDGTVLGTKPSSIFKHSEFPDIIDIEELPLVLSGFFRGRFYFSQQYRHDDPTKRINQPVARPSLYHFSKGNLQEYMLDDSKLSELRLDNYYDWSIKNELSFVDGQLFSTINPNSSGAEFNYQDIEVFTLLKDFYQPKAYSGEGTIVYKHKEKLFYFDKGFYVGGRAMDIVSNVHVFDLNSGISTDLGQWYSSIVPLYQSLSAGWSDIVDYQIGNYFNGKYYFNFGLGPFHGYGGMGDILAPKLTWTDAISPISDFEIQMPDATKISVSNDTLSFNSAGKFWLSDGTAQGTEAFFLESSQFIASYRDTALLEQVSEERSSYWLSDFTQENTIKAFEFDTLVDDIAEYLNMGSKIIYRIQTGNNFRLMLVDWSKHEITLLQDNPEVLDVHYRSWWHTNQCIAISRGGFHSTRLISLINNDEPVQMPELPTEDIKIAQLTAHSFTLKLNSSMEWQIDKPTSLGDVLLKQEGNTLTVTYRGYETTGADTISLRLKEQSCATSNINIPVEVIAKDSDNDGMDDGYEYAYGFNRLTNDASLDLDQDGLTNLAEYLLGTQPNIADTDKDGITDSNDAFPLDDTESVDTDKDGIGNNSDTDDDNDGINDDKDVFPLDRTESVDTDKDGIGDNSDSDDDNDGVSDDKDAFPLDPTKDSNPQNSHSGSFALFLLAFLIGIKWFRVTTYKR